MLHEGWGPVRPKAGFADSIRVVSASLLFLVCAVLRRLLGVRRRAGWSFGLEVLVAAYRGSWSQMPKIGIVRWRKVGDALSPLQTDGLAAKFVRIENGSVALDAAWLEP